MPNFACRKIHCDYLEDRVSRKRQRVIPLLNNSDRVMLELALRANKSLNY